MLNRSQNLKKWSSQEWVSHFFPCCTLTHKFSVLMFLSSGSPTLVSNQWNMAKVMRRTWLCTWSCSSCLNGSFSLPLKKQSAMLWAVCVVRPIWQETEVIFMSSGQSLTKLSRNWSPPSHSYKKLNPAIKSRSFISYASRETRSKPTFWMQYFETLSRGLRKAIPRLLSTELK